MACACVWVLSNYRRLSISIITREWNAAGHATSWSDHVTCVFSINCDYFLLVQFRTRKLPMNYKNTREQYGLEVYCWCFSACRVLRRRLRCRSHCVLYGLLLQRHHRLGHLLLLRFVHHSAAVDDVQQLVEHAGVLWRAAERRQSDDCSAADDNRSRHDRVRRRGPGGGSSSSSCCCCCCCCCYCCCSCSTISSSSRTAPRPSHRPWTWPATAVAMEAYHRLSNTSSSSRCHIVAFRPTLLRETTLMCWCDIVMFRNSIFFIFPKKCLVYRYQLRDIFDELH